MYFKSRVYLINKTLHWILFLALFAFTLGAGGLPSAHAQAGAQSLSVPAAPSNLQVGSVTGDSVTLTWRDNSDNETGFNIYRWDHIGGSWGFYLYAQVGVNSATYTNTQLSCGSNYSYQVSAYNAQGESERAGVAIGSTSACPDLSITNYYFSPGTSLSSDNTWAIIDVQNLGMVDVGAFWIDIYINRIPTGCGDRGDYSVRDDGLAANTTFQEWIKIPAGSLTAGSYQVRAFVDSGCEVKEINENNNLAGPVALTIATPPTAPINDDFDAAKLISPIPFSDLVDVSGATIAPDDPSVNVSACNLAPGLASVWYKYTPTANTRLSLDTFNSDFDTYIAIWKGSRGNLLPVDCNDDFDSPQSALQVALSAGTTYFIEIAEYNGYPLSATSTGSTRLISLQTMRWPAVKTSKAVISNKFKLNTEYTLQAVRTLNFHVAIDATILPGAPTGTLTNWANTFSWTGLANSSYYHLEVYPAAGSTPIFDQWYTTGICSGLSCTVSPAALTTLANGDYKWRVQDYSPAGYGDWTPYTNFTLNLPAIVLAAPSGTLTNWANTFSWTGLASSSYYHLEVYPAGGTTPIFDQWYTTGICSGLSCTVSPAALTTLANGDYKWRVQDYGSAGYGDWTPYTNFTLNLPTIALLSPSGTLATWNNTFSWTGLANSGYYHLEVYLAAGSTPLFDQWYTSSICSGLSCAVSPAALTTLANGDYKWRVQDYSPAGYGGWTPNTNFILNR